MSFFKKMFKKDETSIFVPTPTQSVSGLEPIVVQAVENLFPDSKDQKELFEGLRKYSKNANTLIILALLSMANIDDVEASKKYVLETLSSPVIGTNTNYFIMRDCDFRDMKGAEKWVMSITASRG